MSLNPVLKAYMKVFTGYTAGMIVSNVAIRGTDKIIRQVEPKDYYLHMEEDTINLLTFTWPIALPTMTAYLIGIIIPGKIMKRAFKS